MQALHDVVQMGWVRYIGMSSCWAWQFQLMQRETFSYDPHYSADRGAEYALNNRLTPFVSMQNQHSAMYREEEREMMPMLKHYGIGVIPWGPMAGGRERTFLWRIDLYPDFVASALQTVPGDGLNSPRSGSGERRSRRAGEPNPVPSVSTD